MPKRDASRRFEKSAESELSTENRNRKLNCQQVPRQETRRQRSEHVCLSSFLQRANRKSWLELAGASSKGMGKRGKRRTNVLEARGSWKAQAQQELKGEASVGQGSSRRGGIGRLPRRLVREQ